VSDISFITASGSLREIITLKVWI